MSKFGPWGVACAMLWNAAPLVLASCTSPDSELGVADAWAEPSSNGSDSLGEVESMSADSGDIAWKDSDNASDENTTTSGDGVGDSSQPDDDLDAQRSVDTRRTDATDVLRGDSRGRRNMDVFGTDAEDSTRGDGATTRQDGQIAIDGSAGDVGDAADSGNDMVSTEDASDDAAASDSVTSDATLDADLSPMDTVDAMDAMVTDVAKDSVEDSGPLDIIADTVVQPSDVFICPQWAERFPVPQAPPADPSPCEAFEVTEDNAAQLVPTPVVCSFPYPVDSEPTWVHDLTDAISYTKYTAYGTVLGTVGQIGGIEVSESGSLLVIAKVREEENPVLSENAKPYSDCLYEEIAPTGELLVHLQFGEPGQSDGVHEPSRFGKHFIASGEVSGFGAVPEEGVASTVGVFHVGPEGVSEYVSFNDFSGDGLFDGLGPAYPAGDGFYANLRLSSEGLEAYPCMDYALAKVSYGGELQWWHPIDYTAGPNPWGIFPWTAVHVPGCGYVAASRRGAIAPEFGFGPFSLHALRYINEDGVLIGHRYYWAGVGGYGSLLYTTAGDEIVAVRNIDGVLGGTVVGFGAHVGVLRLKPNSDVKFFSVLSEPEIGASYAAFDSVLALENGLTIVTSSATAYTKATVLDPEGCPLAVYRYGSPYEYLPDAPEHFYHLRRLPTGQFAAHDDAKVYFLDLPAVGEWEAANPTPP